VQIVRRIKNPTQPMVRRRCSSAQYGMFELTAGGGLNHASITTASRQF
jgi:hypothetical protein